MKYVLLRFILLFFIYSTPAELERRTAGLSRPRAAEIHKYLRHKFNSDMLAAKK